MNPNNTEPDNYYEPDVYLPLFDDPSEEEFCHCGVPRRLHNDWQEGHSFTSMRLPEFQAYEFLHDELPSTFEPEGLPF